MNASSDIPVIILAGGKGTRIKHLLGDLPKPMYPVFEIPFLDYVISYLKKFGLSKFIISSGYQSEIIEQHYKNKPNILVIKEEEALGTGGAIMHCMQKDNSSENYLALNGDTLFLIDFSKFLNFSLISMRTCIALKKNQDTARYGSIALNTESTIISFSEKNTSNVEELKLINGGIYFLNKKEIENLDLPKINSLEVDVFPQLVSKRTLMGYSQDFNAEFIDIGTPETLYQVEEFISKHKLQIN
ncbi:MAG: NTP transferase domain-containing protein [Bacteroidetes bacterium]|nr:NTP transferase domain-containing protein [Bacteroidota bacterium]